jgi:fluoride exporter
MESYGGTPVTPAVLLLVGTGGALGSWLRYRIAGAVYARTGPHFPWGTLTVNVIGSFALGLLLPVMAAQHAGESLRAFVAVGCIGAFTTYSTFAYEAAALIMAGERVRTVAYAVASVTLGLAAIAGGLMLGGLLT